jgi:hypothetical protein
MFAMAVICLTKHQREITAFEFEFNCLLQNIKKYGMAALGHTIIFRLGRSIEVGEINNSNGMGSAVNLLVQEYMNK